MREIKFRGKRIDNSEWVYGSLIIDEISGKHYITISAEESEKVNEEGCLRVVSCEVIPETVGEYTRLDDMNGKGIYEGDILLKNKSYKFVISYKNGAFIRSFENSNIYLLYDAYITDGFLEEYEVTGNIYEDGHLLEDGE